MQNKYVGDIGDFGKYGLLRWLSPAWQRLGVVWCLVPDERHLNDGRHVDYLARRKYRECDPELFETLKSIVGAGKREVSEIEQSGLLAAGTAFYSEYLSYDGVKATSTRGREMRLVMRRSWMARALEKVSGCDSIFLDPDNGLQTPSVSRHAATAPKYVYADEVLQFLSRAVTLIVYHHLGRNGDHTSQIQRRKADLKSIAGSDCDIRVLHFRRYSPRAYFLMTKEKEILNRVSQLAASEWRQCFDLVV
jgi:hypothetical protein